MLPAARRVRLAVAEVVTSAETLMFPDAEMTVEKLAMWRTRSEAKMFVVPVAEDAKNSPPKKYPWVVTPVAIFTFAGKAPGETTKEVAIPASDVKTRVCAEATVLVKPSPVKVAMPSTALTVNELVRVTPLS
jgi:hypothetical protein